MPSPLKPKEVLREAEEAARNGNVKKASQNYAILASFLRKKGKYDEALKMLSKAATLSPGSARLLVLRARICAEKGKMDAAKQSVREFTSLALENKRLQDYQAYFDEQLAKHPSLRREHYEVLLAWDRTNPEYFNRLAETCMEMGDGEEAKKVLFAALKDKSLFPAVSHMLKEVFRKLGESESIDLLEKVEGGANSVNDFLSLVSKSEEVSPVKQSPKEDSASHAFEREERELRNLIEELEKDLGIEKESEFESVKPLVQEFRRQADKILDNDSKARIDLALAFFEMGLYRDALSELATVSETDKLSVEARSLEAQVYVAEGSDLSALERYQYCLRQEHLTDEQHKDVLYRTIEVYMRLGDIPQALQLANQLSKIDPDYRKLHQLTLTLKERASR